MKVISRVPPILKENIYIHCTILHKRFHVSILYEYPLKVRQKSSDNKRNLLCLFKFYLNDLAILNLVYFTKQTSERLSALFKI